MSHFGQFPPVRTLTVGPGGAFATIAAAIASAAAATPAPSVTAQVVIVVGPGVYTEAPFTIPTGVVLKSSGGAQGSVTIVASTATAALVTLSPSCAFRGFTVSGADGVGGIGVLAATAGLPALVHEVIVTDCTTNYHITSGATVEGAFLSASRAAPGDAGTTGFLVDAGGIFEATSVQAIGSAGAPFTDGILVTGAASRTKIGTCRFDNNTDGIHADDGAIAEFGTGTLDGNVNALHVGSTGTGGNLRTFDISITNSTAFDIVIDASNGSWFNAGGTHDESLMNMATGADVAVYALSETPVTGEQSLHVVAELHVGTERFPRESAFGEGDSHVRGLAAFTSVSLDAGAFVDVTSILESPTGSTTAAFPTGAVGNALFIGGDQTFTGIKLNTTTAVALGAGALVLEVSDGVGGWIAIDVCVCDSVSPYLSHAQDIFGRVAFEQVRFEALSGVAWAAQSINGVSKFWLRIRVITAVLGTNPVIESVKLGTNRTEINADGIVESFGTGEKISDLIMHQQLTYDLAGASSPGNAAIVVSANITLTPVDNSFVNNALDGISAIITIPEGLDTSRPVLLHIHWIPSVNTAGDVEWETNAVEVRHGDTLDGTLPEVAGSLVHAVAGGSQDVVQESELSFSITELEPGDQLVFSLFRDAQAGNLDDTLAGNAEIVSLDLRGTFWR
jgi:hypothetical protein